ncbi:MAG: hypothetical protein JST59_16165 [Actinobacteria bacterium]|nr:hypothetical protein [Actinomycetota bacterium]
MQGQAHHSPTAGDAGVVLRLRAAARGTRRRLLLLLAVLALGGLIVTHHVEPKGMDGMAGSICLAVLGGVALLGRPSAGTPAGPTSTLAVARPAAAAQGPALAESSRESGTPLPTALGSPNLIDGVTATPG